MKLYHQKIFKIFERMPQNQSPGFSLYMHAYTLCILGFLISTYLKITTFANIRLEPSILEILQASKLLSITTTQGFPLRNIYLSYLNWLSNAKSSKFENHPLFFICVFPSAIPALHRRTAVRLQKYVSPPPMGLA